MLNRLIEFSLTQRLLILVFAALVAGAGTYAFMKLPIDAFPDISPTQVKIILKAPGMTPEEVEQRVIVPLEMELLGIPRQAILRSMAKYAIADITIDFDEGTDVYWARQQVAERLSGAMGPLPDTVIGRPGADLHAAVRRVHVHDRGRQSDARRAAHAARLGRSVRRSAPCPASPTSIRSAAMSRPSRSFPIMARWSVPDSPSPISRTAIMEANRNDGAGRLQDGEEGLIVRAVGAIQTLDDLARGHRSSSPTVTARGSAILPRSGSARSPATAPSPRTAKARRSKAWCSRCAAPTRAAVDQGSPGAAREAEAEPA